MSDDLSVLVVDDDFFVAGLHADIVNSTPGFAALAPARDGRTALRQITASEPDLLLVDTYLPDGSGIDLLKTTEIDAFVLSAATDPRNVRTAFRRGAFAYLIKPFPGRRTRGPAQSVCAVSSRVRVRASARPSRDRQGTDDDPPGRQSEAGPVGH